MKHNLTMIAETPEPGVFVTIIRDGDEIIDTVKGRHPAGVAVCAYRPGHSKPLRPIYGLTAGHVKPEVKALKAKGYKLRSLNCNSTTAEARSYILTERFSTSNLRTERSSVWQNFTSCLIASWYRFSIWGVRARRY